MTFNPAEHLISLKGKNYLPVQWRLVWFREMCPLGIIETERSIIDLENRIAVFRACVSDGKGASACGHGSESAKDFADYIEKAETKAIGRALAALGYGTQFCGDELNEGSRIVDSPVALTLGKVKNTAKRAEIAVDLTSWQDFVARTLGRFVADKDISPEQLELLYAGCTV